MEDILSAEAEVVQAAPPRRPRLKPSEVEKDILFEDVYTFSHGRNKWVRRKVEEDLRVTDLLDSGALLEDSSEMEALGLGSTDSLGDFRADSVEKLRRRRVPTGPKSDLFFQSAARRGFASASVRQILDNERWPAARAGTLLREELQGKPPPGGIDWESAEVGSRKIKKATRAIRDGEYEDDAASRRDLKRRARKVSEEPEEVENAVVQWMQSSERKAIQARERMMNAGTVLTGVDVDVASNDALEKSDLVSLTPRQEQDFDTYRHLSDVVEYGVNDQGRRVRLPTRLEQAFPRDPAGKKRLKDVRHARHLKHSRHAWLASNAQAWKPQDGLNALRVLHGQQPLRPTEKQMERMLRGPGLKRAYEGSSESELSAEVAVEDESDLDAEGVRAAHRGSYRKKYGVGKRVPPAKARLLAATAELRRRRGG